MLVLSWVCWRAPRSYRPQPTRYTRRTFFVFVDLFRRDGDRSLRAIYRSEQRPTPTPMSALYTNSHVAKHARHKALAISTFDLDLIFALVCLAKHKGLARSPAVI